jgi:hypothetical protein
VANLILQFILMLRKSKAKRFSYASLMLSITSAFLFIFLPFMFEPCVYPGITIPTGPCQAFYGTQVLDENRLFWYGPYGGWYCAFFGFFTCVTAFLLALLSPTPPPEFSEV